MPTTIAGIVYDFRLRSKNFRNNVKTINSNLRSLRTSARAANDALRFDPKNTLAQKVSLEALRGETEQYKQAIIKAKREISKTNAEYTKQKIAIDKTLEAGKRVSSSRQASFQRAQKNLATAQKNEQIYILKAIAAQKRLQAEVLKTSQLRSESLIKTGRSISNALGGVLLRLGLTSGFAAQQAGEFENKIGKIATIAKETYNYEKLRDKIYELSSMFGIASQDIAEGWYHALSSGLETTADLTKETEFMATATKLAKAGFGEMELTVKALASIMATYNLTSKDAQSIGDKLVKTQNSGILTVSELSQFLSKATFNGSQLGVSLEDVLAALASMTRAGANTARASTYLNRTLVDFGRTSSKISKIIKSKTGKSFRELMDEGYNLGQVLSFVKKEALETDQEFIDMFSSIRAAQGALGIFGKDGNRFNNILNKIKNSQGELNDALSQQQRFTKFKDAVIVLKNAFALFGRGILENFLPLLEKLKKLITDNSEAIVKFGFMFGKALTTLAVVFAGGKILTGIGLISKAFITITSSVKALGGLKTIFLSFGGAIAPALKVLIALGLAMKTLYNSSELVKNLVDGSFKTALKAIGIIFKSIAFFVNLITSGIEKMGKFIDRVASKISGRQFGSPENNSNNNPSTSVRDTSKNKPVSQNNITFNIASDAELTDEKKQEIADLIENYIGGRTTGG